MIWPDIFKNGRTVVNIGIVLNRGLDRVSKGPGLRRRTIFCYFMQKTSYELKLGQSILHLLQGSDTLQGFSLAG